jgi:curved DNA-binding protein
MMTLRISYDDFTDFFNSYFSGNINLEDLFGRSPGNRSARGRYEYKGEDVQATISITPQEGFFGQKKRVTLSDGLTQRTISFKIPAGIKPGERIKLAGQGGKSGNGVADGDLYIDINFTEDGSFKANGLDLEMTLELLPWDAALGSEIAINTIDEKILLKTPPGIQTESKIKVAGKGYKDRAGKRGDLYIKIKIVNPRVISEGLKELYLKIRQLNKA